MRPIVLDMPRVLPEYKELVKSKIIQAAIKIFSMKGYYASRMIDIAKKIGISKATLYLYFKSKEDLLKMISISINQKLGAIFSKSFEMEDLTEAAEEIYNRIDNELQEQLPIGLELLSLASNDEIIRKIARDDREKGLEVIASSLQHHIKKNLVRTDRAPRDLAQLVLGLCWDVLLQQIIGCEKSIVHANWIKSISILLNK